MDLLLLFVLGIVISEYTEKKLRVVNIVNSIVFVIFSLLIFYGSENSLIVYAAKHTLNGLFYTSLHSLLRFTIEIFGIQISSYFLLLTFLILVSFVIGTIITIKIVKSFIKIKRDNKAENLIDKTAQNSIYESGIKINKLYLVFGRFLS